MQRNSTEKIMFQKKCFRIRTNNIKNHYNVKTKLHIRSNRIQGNASLLIKLEEEHFATKAGRNTELRLDP